MVTLGETRPAKDIGRRGRERYIWHACSLCSRQRWTSYRQGKERHTLCRACANRIRARGRYGCRHWWIIDMRDVGRCKYCGEVRDFRALRVKFEKGCIYSSANWLSRD